MKDLLLKRRTTRYSGDDLPIGRDIEVELVKPVTLKDDEFGECDGYRIRLPESGKTIDVFEDTLSPMPNMPLTNVELLTLIMERSQSGALMQAFVMQAVESYAKAVAEAKPEDLDAPMISGAAWHKCGVEVGEWFAARDAEDEARRNRVS